MAEKSYFLHWDSKKMKAMVHTEDDIERIAVVLTGNIYTLDKFDIKSFLNI